VAVKGAALPLLMLLLVQVVMTPRCLLLLLLLRCLSVPALDGIGRASFGQPCLLLT
jgi:hypothetical protein